MTILLATVGTAGDLNPFLAVGQALVKSGADVILAASDMHREAVEANGLALRPVGPPIEEALAGVSLASVAERLIRDDTALLRILVPHLRRAYADCLAALDGVSMVVTHPLALGAQWAAERALIPHVSLALSPAVLFSAYEPPGGIGSLFINEPGRLGLAWNRALLAGMRCLTSPITASAKAFRLELGLPPVRAPFFTMMLHAKHLAYFRRY